MLIQSVPYSAVYLCESLPTEK